MDRYGNRNTLDEASTMDKVTLSTKYQLVVPRGARERLGLRPGAKLRVLDKGGVLFLVPDRPTRRYRGVARGARPRGLREKKDRL
jgi:AbrB family looped-hinge helix DNA binding protein